jgi:CBS domain-containing protein
VHRYDRSDQARLAEGDGRMCAPDHHHLIRRENSAPARRCSEPECIQHDAGLGCGPRPEETSMQVGEICTREVICADTETTITAAAKLMRQYHIGDVIVTREEQGRRVPLGIVTDRDVVIGVIAPELNPNTLTVGDIMSTSLITAIENEDVFDAVQRMRNKGVRRIPIVQEDGGLIGILSIDDVIEILSEEMNQLARLISRAQFQEYEMRR